MYNFDKMITRWDTNCIKWDGAASTYGANDLLPMWVADMDFTCPNPVLAAIQKRTQHPIFGYSFPSSNCYQAIIDKFQRDFKWNIKKEWIIFSHGVVDGIHSAIKGISKPNDNIIIQSPVYYPFFSVIENNQCQIIDNSLKIEANQYKIQFNDLEKKLANGAKALLLCSPHNPVGRVWTEAELSHIADLCIKYNCLLLSDEIHCDIVYKPYHHTAIGSMGESIAKRSISFYSVSKTYNTPGLTTAFMVIPDDTIRNQVLCARMGQNGGNLFGYEATTAAYSESEQYHKELLTYLQKNIEYFIQFINENLPQVTVYPPQGTYLLWADFRKCGYSEEELNNKLINECRLILDEGSLFGSEGKGFFRFNLACPRQTITTALERIVNILK